jgi:hypothetical protein
LEDIIVVFAVYLMTEIKDSSIVMAVEFVGTVHKYAQHLVKNKYW